MKKNYRDLIVWQKAIQLAPKIYKLVHQLPKEETFALGLQLRRAVVSVASNIAEGQSRGHKKEFIQHLNIAKGSLAELHTQIIIAEELHYLTSEELRQTEDDIGVIAKMLHGVMGKIKTTENKSPVLLTDGTKN